MYKNKFLSKLYSYSIRKLRNIIFIFLSMIFKFLDILFPKQNNLIVFAQKNNLFSDNSKAFFEFINNNKNEFETIWFVDSKNEKEKFKKKYGYKNVKLMFSIDGLLTLLKARTVVISNALQDFFPYFSPSFRKEAIQLWHGIKWSKKFEFPNNNFTKELTIICSSSEEHKLLISNQNKVDLNKIYITGLPRNDFFFTNDKKKRLDNLPLEIKNDLSKKIILYAPTHREDLISIFFPFNDKNLEKLNIFLKENNAVFYLRPHINDTNKAQQEWKNFFEKINQSEIKSLTFKELQDINQLLPFINSLITDYSTIYTDAILLDIPTIFIPYDIEVYEKKRGLVYDYEKITAGDKVLDQKRLIESLSRIFAQKDLNKLKIEEIKKKFHKFQDGGSSKRILDILRSKIKIKI
jgi:CDP-glycerol glycerophosphotransferase (TagB/SpsB family)